jgi:hypothetical protein
MRGLASFLVVIGALSFAATQARAVDITECGQVVPPRQVGNLVGDLDCTDTDSGGVWLERGATLNLNGFGIIGSAESRSDAGVDCIASCRVNGPGTIIGFDEGIDGGAKKMRITDVDIVGSWQHGVEGDNVVLTRCTVSGTSDRAAVSGVLYDRYGRKSKIKIVDSVISDNAQHGVTGVKVVVRDSVIVGNGFDCPFDACYDIYVSKKALLRNTTFGSCEATSGGKCRSR